MSIINERLTSLLNFLDALESANFTQLKSLVKNSKTLTNDLKNLISEKLIIHKNKQYFLSEQGKLIVEPLIKILSILSIPIDNLQDVNISFLLKLALGYLIRALIEDFQDRICLIMLFGSLTRNNYNETSDIDLFILFDEEVNYKTYEELVDSQCKFWKTWIFSILQYNNIDFRIQFLPFNAEQINKDHAILPVILKEGVTLHSRGSWEEKFRESVINLIHELDLVEIHTYDGKIYWKARRDIK